jgi:ribosomal protein S18 acetylase RimI-like enzyme
MHAWAPMIETRWFLEMNDPGDLRPSREPGAPFELRRHEPPDPDLASSLYARVGHGWRWVDRLAWSREDWARHLANPAVSLWVLRDGEQPAGYFELATSPDASVEIAYFGLLPEHVGHGLGGYLLTAAVRRAFALGGRRVWLHTCSRDHPHALPNYQARGFRVFRTEPL